MGYPIKSKEYHQKQIEGIRERKKERQQRLRGDTDGAMSDWANDQSIRYHRNAISVIENDMMSTFPALVDKEEDRELDAQLVDGQYGLVWLLSDEEEEQYGRRFVPWNRMKGTSRVQKELGLEERNVEKKVAPFFDVQCAHRGAPLTFNTVPAEEVQ